MTIHGSHPFADPDPDPVRRLRGRLGGGVTLWTAGADKPVGLTVSSVMVAAGDPPAVLALLDPDSDLAEELTAGSGRAVVQLLQWRHRDLAEVFAGTAPAPGGRFARVALEETPWGPRLADAPTWAGLRLVDARPVGWSLLVTCTPEHVEVGEEDVPLAHRRGRYQRPVE